MNRRLATAVAVAALALASCGEESLDKVELPPEGERVPITQRAIAAVALEHLPDETTSRQAAYTEGVDPAHSLGADLRFGGDGEYDGDLVQIFISDKEKARASCGKQPGCVELKADDGSPMILTWDEVEPEEDPGYVSVTVDHEGEWTHVGYSGPEITGDPRKLKLPISVETLTAVAQDPRLRLRTSPAVVAAGEELDDWDGGEPDPEAWKVVPSTDRSLAAAYLSTRGGYGDYSLIEPSPLKSEFGAGAIGARLHRDSQGADPAVIDVLATPKPPAWLAGNPCAGDRFREHCATYDDKVEVPEYDPPPLPPAKGPVYLLWTPTAAGVPGEVWAVQRRADELVAYHQSGFRVPEKKADVEGALEWYLLREQLVAGTFGLETTKEIAESTDSTPGWQD